MYWHVQRIRDFLVMRCINLLFTYLNITADRTGGAGAHVKAPHLTHDTFGGDSDVNPDLSTLTHSA